MMISMDAFAITSGSSSGRRQRKYCLAQGSVADQTSAPATAAIASCYKYLIIVQIILYPAMIVPFTVPDTFRYSDTLPVAYGNLSTT